MSMQFWDTLELERNGMTFSENGKLAEIQGGSRDLQHASVALFAEYQYIFYFTLRASAAAVFWYYPKEVHESLIFLITKDSLVHYLI